MTKFKNPDDIRGCICGGASLPLLLPPSLHPVSRDPWARLHVFVLSEAKDAPLEQRSVPSPRLRQEAAVTLGASVDSAVNLLGPRQGAPVFCPASPTKNLVLYLCVCRTS